MTAQIKNELDLIVQAITARTSAVAIYLFGSYAYGEPNANSDLDVYAVIPDSDVDTIQLGADIYHELHHQKTMPLDLLIGKNSVFNRRKEGPTLERVIVTEGKKIYG